jgi:hypothetical protein
VFAYKNLTSHMDSESNWFVLDPRIFCPTRIRLVLVLSVIRKQVETNL